MVQRRTGLIDRTLREAYARLATAGPMPALLAIGGYGRGELNPHSDIDIMFLCRDEEDRKRAPELLYLLWDAGLDVGYSVRTAKECVSLARQDIKIRTSLLESRLIAGDPGFTIRSSGSCGARSFTGSPRRSSTKKSRNGSQRAGSTAAPSICGNPTSRKAKAGSGTFIRRFGSPLCTSGSIRSKNWSQRRHHGRQYAVFLRSRNFLWRVRNEIHYLSGRKNDHLTFDLQERAAKDFQYRDSAHLLAVERFMKAYFLHARNIREFSNIVFDAVLRKPSAGWFQRTQQLGPFSLIGRTLFLASSETDARKCRSCHVALSRSPSRDMLFFPIISNL